MHVTGDENDNDDLMIRKEVEAKSRNLVLSLSERWSWKYMVIWKWGILWYVCDICNSTWRLQEYDTNI